MHPQTWKTLDNTIPWLLGDEPSSEEISDPSRETGGRYETVREVGRGGMSVVVEAIDRLTGSPVALKRMRTPVKNLAFRTMEDWGLSDRDDPTADNPQLTSMARLRYALAREFQTLSTLRHPNIISVLDYGFNESLEPFFTMELLASPLTLLEAAADRTLAERIELFAQILRALIYLHRRGVLHRDLKPSNILVTDRVQVLDFGVAIRSDQIGQQIAGTLAYLAPEIFRFQPYTERSDLYAVGMIAYEVFAGTHPFDISSSNTLMQGALREEPDFTKVDAPPAVVEVIRQLLSKDPAARPASAAETLDRLYTAAGLPPVQETRATRESFLQAAEFVNRDDERAALETALSAMMTERGGVCLIEGTSGLGKSRLLDEFRTLSLVLGAQVIRGQATTEAQQAYDLWLEPLKLLLLSAPVGTLAPADLSVLKNLIPDLDQLLGIEIADAPLNPQAAKQQVVATIQSQLTQQDRPTVILLEDLQWARESLEVLADLAGRIADKPVLVVGSYRTEETPRLAEHVAGAVRIPLAPLGSRYIAELADAMVGSHSAHILDFLEENTEGNPFFIVETVRALAEEAGTLDQVARSPLPSQIQAAGIDAIVQRRLRLVDAETLPFLRWCAILGRQPDLAVIQRALGEGAVGSGLAQISDLMLLEIRDNRWRFTHDRFREGILAALSPAERQALHRQAAGHLAALYGDDESAAAALAHHHGCAGNTAEEARYAAAAGRLFHRQGAYLDAIRWLRVALEKFSARPDAAPAEELDLRLLLGTMIMPIQGWGSEETRELYDRVIALATQTGQAARIGPALHGHCMYNMMLGALNTSQGFSLRSLTLSAEAGDDVMRQHALIMRAQTAHWLGRHDETIHYSEQSLPLFSPDQIPRHFAEYSWDPRMANRVCYTWSQWMVGNIDRAVELGQEGLRIEQETPNPFSRAIIYQVLGWVHQLRREVDEARENARLLRELSEELGFAPFMVLVNCLEGWGLVQCGQPEAGLALLRPAFQAWEQVSAVLVTTYYTTLYTDACLAAGEIDEGLAAVERALGGAFLTEERNYHPELHRLRGEFLRQKGDLAAAEADFRAGLALADEQGARSWALRCATSLGDLLLDQQRGAEVRDTLITLLEHFTTQRPTPDILDANQILLEIEI
jgi:serine/threonine protein kinase/tetratricopeptide (TPR) repeat protein